jgi:hypothetical protein
MAYGVCLVRAGSELRGEGKLEAVISDGVRGFRGTQETVHHVLPCVHDAFCGVPVPVAVCLYVV